MNTKKDVCKKTGVRKIMFFLATAILSAVILLTISPWYTPSYALGHFDPEGPSPEGPSPEGPSPEGPRQYTVSIVYTDSITGEFIKQKVASYYD